jgi:hypothetical protein
MRQQGRPESDIEGISMFSAVGLQHFDGAPKPAMAVWDAFRQE